MALKWNRHNGNWLISASRDHFCKLFDIRNLKEEVQCFRGHKKEACSKLYSFDSCKNFTLLIFHMAIKLQQIKRSRIQTRMHDCHYFLQINKINRCRIAAKKSLLYENRVSNFVQFDRLDLIKKKEYENNQISIKTDDFVLFHSSIGMASNPRTSIC